MLIQLNPRDWKVLRALARAKNKPVVGASLRPDMGRFTKDGTFLNQLVRLGLLAVSEQGHEPFTSAYVLTETGKHAAEYGEFEMPWDEYKRLTEKTKSTVTEPGAVEYRVPPAASPSPPQSPATSQRSGIRPGQSAAGPRRPRRK